MNEFIKRLSVESHLSYSDAGSFITYICSIGGITDTIYNIYNEQGVRGLEIYAEQLKLGVKY
ncbi:hypothetical protein FDF86_04545 [Clostridium botulinum]|nr:hypothetical protein [Clostridium botulinum]NFT91685.1 hypothetical protein [Clostridium botulinum]